jgi:arylsulfatase A-like enzyme
MIASFKGLLLLAVAVAIHPMSEARGAEHSGDARRPNIMVIVVDDMGYSDAGCHGGEIATPNVDRLAQGGLRFTQFYNCARCCQTRASLLTGAYPERVGMREFGRTMDTDVPTVAENLREGGYMTAMAGKWHLSELPRTQSEAKRILWMNHELDLGIAFADPRSYPTQRGFEHFYGIIWGVVDHFDPFSLTRGEHPVATVPDGYYMTDAISRQSVDYVRDFSSSEQPFFLYVAYTAPHWPLHAPQEEIAKYRDRYTQGWAALREERHRRQEEMDLFGGDIPLGPLSGREQRWADLSDAERDYQATKMAVHAAMVDRVDQGIGQILGELERSGELDNTLILFLSDNGASPEIPGEPGYDRNSGTRDGRVALREHALRQPANQSKVGSDESYAGIGPHWASAVNTPLRYWKAESYDGGCRTPLVVHWPEGIQAEVGGFVSDLGHVIDVAPTCYAVANVQPMASTLSDGISLVPVLQGEDLGSNRSIYFEHGRGAGVRHDQWKASKRGGQRWQLFNAEEDPGETADLAEERPELLAALIASWREWEAEVTRTPSAVAAQGPPASGAK